MKIKKVKIRCYVITVNVLNTAKILRILLLVDAI